ncbi:MAG: glycosyltransferase family 2 protein [Candidatus Pacebacteria bacterium]|nr:glycosyltransferase family 2 protein [Candidatus Paceibacterota bacterium]
MLNIVIPMAGRGSRFKDAGYVFPKPLIDVKGKTMIEVVTRNLRPKGEHRFVFICQREHVKEYDLYNILKNATEGNFEIVQIDGVTAGAACTVLCATPYIDDDNEMLIANSDQFINIDINSFLTEARHGEKDGLIMTFEASHPKWSYARTDKDGLVLEVAEKKVISNQATVGIYYFGHGKDFVAGAQEMIKKDVRHNNEFYVCPVYNEMILRGKKIYTYPIDAEKMHGLGTPEDLELFLRKLESGKVSLS